MQNQLSQLKDLLKIHYGYSEFRFGQEQAIKNILEQKSTVVIMPTGGGKSLIYQLPSLLLDGITIVISPLIALMKDQVDSMEQIGIPATFINSSLSLLETQNRITAIKDGNYRLVYIAPERFYSQEFINLLNDVKVSLFAIDEAHCISEWGHDFRPSYMRLKEIIKLVGNPTVLAVTATATPEVKEDIIKQLDLEAPEVIITGFNRPNLKFGVMRATDAQKYTKILNIVQQVDGSGIIYTGTRQKVEDMLNYLTTNGINAVGYHAGMNSQDRKYIQNEFMQGNTQVIIATNAFGLGIDKSDIRFVIHFDMPGTIEAYYQEAGRAGRDGQQSYCIMFYSPADRYLREFFIKGDNPPPKVILEVYETLLSYENDTALVTYATLVENISEKVPDMAIGTALKILEREKYIERSHEKYGRAFLKFLHDAEYIKQQLSSKAKVQNKTFDGLIKHLGDSLQDGIEFSPDDIADISGVKRDAVTRLIKKLSDENLVEYKPPFRGTEIKVLQRLKPENLNINFTALKEKHKRELNKLDLMENYIYDYGCRKKYILDYFKDTGAEECGICDNCVAGLKSENEIDEPYPKHKSISPDDIKITTKLTQLETHELYKQGHSIDEMAQIRNIKPGTIIQHLCFLIEHGKDIDIDKFVNSQTQNRIKKAIKKVGVDKLTPIKEELGDDVNWDDIRLVVANLK
ncbi:MAG: RecQ family ATP-dependent DNA helicase [Candidatus Falkowbacteria bacterium]